MTNEANFSSVTQFDKDATVLFTLPHIDLSKLFGFGRCPSQLEFEILNESPKKHFTFLLSKISLSENRQDTFLAL